MKKGLLILLCLPLIGFGQVIMQSNEYTPGFTAIDKGYASMGTDPMPEEFLHFFDWTYLEIPDSLYGVSYLSGGSGSLSVWGYMNTHPGTLLFSEWYANVGNSFAEISLTQTLNGNNQAETINTIETGFSSETFIDSIFYDTNNEYERIIHRDISNSLYKRTEFISPAGTISVIKYFDTPNANISLQTDSITYNSANFVSTIQTGNTSFEYIYNANNLLEYVFYSYNGVLVDTVALYFYDGGLPEYCIEKQYDITNQTLIYTQKQELIHDIYDRFISEKTFELDNGVWTLIANMNFVYYSTPSAVDEIHIKKRLVSVKDILGRETKGKNNEPLFYIYDDGTVEKRIVIE